MSHGERQGEPRSGVPDANAATDHRELDTVARHVGPQPHLPDGPLAPPLSGSGFMDALLAGIAEKACDDAGVPRPGWARRVPGVAMPWISPGTPRMQAAARAGTPPQLAARNIFVRADSLWRGAAAVGA